MELDKRWEEYFKRTRSMPPRALLVKALPYIENKQVALDMGSGALNDSIFLLSSRFSHVTALDKSPVALDIAKELPIDHFKYEICSFEDFAFQANTYDLINAQYALPFISPNEFNRVFKNSKKSLKVGGILTGQFFGERDEWKDNPTMTFHTVDQVKQLLKDFEILDFEEEEVDKLTAMA